MTQKGSKAQLAILEQEREHTINELENLRAELRVELDHDDVDDAASDLIERDKIQAIILTLQRKLEDVEHAIKLAKAGSYGICESCGKVIEPERLEIFPETTLCVNCKRASERSIRSAA